MQYIQLPNNPTLSANVAGSFLDKTSYVFLSSTFDNEFPPILPITAFDGFSTRANVSASFVPFSGINITAYCNLQNTNAVINLNALNNLFLFDTVSDQYDLIFLNVAGYSTLSEKGILLTVSPSNSGIIVEDYTYRSSEYINVTPSPIILITFDTLSSTDNFLNIGSGGAPYSSGDSIITIS